MALKMTGIILHSNQLHHPQPIILTVLRRQLVRSDIDPLSGRLVYITERDVSLDRQQLLFSVVDYDMLVPTYNKESRLYLCYSF